MAYILGLLFITIITTPLIKKTKNKYLKYIVIVILLLLWGYVIIQQLGAIYIRKN